MATRLCASHDPTLCVALKDWGVVDAETAIAIVLDAFVSMGATDADVLRERQRLQTDDAFFDEWCRRMPEWYAGAEYVCIDDDSTR